MDQTFWPSHWPESSQPTAPSNPRSDAALLCRAASERLDVICEAAETNSPRLRAGSSNSVMTAVRELSDLFFGMLHQLPTNPRGTPYSRSVSQQFLSAVGTTELAALEKVVSGFTLERGVQADRAELVSALNEGLDRLITASHVLEFEPSDSPSS